MEEKNASIRNSHRIAMTPEQLEAAQLATQLVTSGHCVIILGDNCDASWAIVDAGPMMIGG